MSAQTAHTPGPLMAHVNSPVYSDGKHSIMIEADGKFFARAYGLTLEEAQANARLSAAAPELLAALTGLEDMVSADEESMRWPAMRAWVKDARAAIAKATGVQS